MMPGLRLQWMAEAVAADTHLALLGIKIGETALWEYLFISICPNDGSGFYFCGDRWSGEKAGACERNCLP